MTETTTDQAQAAISSVAVPAELPASKVLGVMLMAQAELLQGISISSRTGLSAVVAIELSNHLQSLGAFLAMGHGEAVIYDRVHALTSMVVATIMAGTAMEGLNIRVTEALTAAEDSDAPTILRDVLEQLRNGTFNPLASVPDMLDTLLAGYVDPLPETAAQPAD